MSPQPGAALEDELAPGWIPPPRRGEHERIYFDDRVAIDFAEQSLPKRFASFIRPGLPGDEPA